MIYSDLVSNFITLIAITLAPGPCVLMLIVRSASKDVLGAFGFGIGYALGGVVITSVVCFGLGAWLTVVPEVFEYSKYVMMAYILWLAFGVWKGEFKLESECTSKRRSVLSSLGAGILTCFISPYMMVLFPLVLTNLIGTTEIKLQVFFSRRHHFRYGGCRFRFYHCACSTDQSLHSFSALYDDPEPQFGQYFGTRRWLDGFCLSYCNLGHLIILIRDE